MASLGLVQRRRHLNITNMGTYGSELSFGKKIGQDSQFWRWSRATHQRVRRCAPPPFFEAFSPPFFGVDRIQAVFLWQQFLLVFLVPSFHPAVSFKHSAGSEARSTAWRMAQFPFESQAAAAGIWRKGHWYSWVMKNFDSEVLQI